MTKSTKKREEKELLRRFCSGDEAAFRDIVQEYKDPLFNFLRRFVGNQDLIEDVFQDTFMQLYQSRESFDLDRPLKPWLFTIAANKAKDLLRKRKRNSSISVGSIADESESSIEDVFSSVSSEDTTPLDSYITEETEHRVREVVENMPEKLREILLLAYFEQFSYKQMAEMLSIPIGTVKSRLHSAVARFAKDLKNAEPDFER
ncbi:Sigma-W factor [Sedimentisphaera cyanobacteriorum]|uniref:Sigma-W factor n=1 Tax=Sedimentisphaera cyanobacteriorum TaxID=1940790 RepID=A0A1Q2HQ86_9BACT|nr:RNA polymerase sigma factor [Sedimentisphaera cyanobacteriorum]AQQ09622.1 Sigma-W factor [Sedimentisphaera cyanobacteriorum]